MTKGHDGADDRSSGGEGDESPDHDDQSESDWDQPRPGETRSDGSETTSRREENRARTDSPRPSSGSEHEEGQSSETVQDQSQKTGRGVRNPASPEAHSEPGESVAISEEARDDGQWIDLAEHRPGGQALAAGDLSPEKLEEYTTDRRSLSPLVQVHWGIRVTIGALIVGLIATWGLGALGYNQQLGGILVGGLVLLGLAWVVLYYRRWLYEVRADAIYLERGVVTHVRTLVPYVRIQHVDTSQSPIERMLGLSTLVVYTAGSRGADVSIPGLNPEEARDLQRRVKELAIEAEGDDAL